MWGPRFLSLLSPSPNLSIWFFLLLSWSFKTSLGLFLSLSPHRCSCNNKESYAYVPIWQIRGVAERGKEGEGVLCRPRCELVPSLFLSSPIPHGSGERLGVVLRTSGAENSCTNERTPRYEIGVYKNFFLFIPYQKVSCIYGRDANDARLPECKISGCFSLAARLHFPHTSTKESHTKDSSDCATFWNRFHRNTSSYQFCPASPLRLSSL